MSDRPRHARRWLAIATAAALVTACVGGAPSPTSTASPGPAQPSASPGPTPLSSPPPVSPPPASNPTPSPSAPSASRPTPAATFAPSPDAEIHVASRGDTLWEIGQLYDVSVAQLLAANPQITNRNLIRPGDRIVIPPVQTPGTALPDLASSNVERAALDAAAAKRAAGWINAFGIDLYRAALKDGSLDPGAGAAVSPTSIALALALARAGAKGTTASQIDAVLHAPDGTALRRGLGSLDQVLASRNRLWTDWATHAVALRVANGAFIQRDWAIEPAFLRRLAADYGSGAWRVDFAANPGAALRTVNAWVKSKTRGRIPELLDPLDSATRLVLVNAVYLKAEWERWFWEGATEPETFRRLDGTTVKVPTMHRTAGGGCLSPPIAYAAGTGWRAIDLRTAAPEDGSPLSMIVVVPDDLRAFEKTLTAARLEAIATRLDRERRMFDTGTLPKGARCTHPLGCYPYDVALHMPKFTVESKASLVGVLSALGMPLAFGPGADFSGIHAPATETDRLYITFVVHQANVSIDERGIEAAAATAVGEGCAGPGPLKKIELKVNRPFLFVIRDKATGAFLFVGRVVDPSAGA